MIKQIPNLITVSRLMLLPLLVYFIWLDKQNYNWYAMYTLIFISFGDLLDGFLARKLNAITKIGKIIDPTADKLVILVSIIMLLYIGNINPIIAILVLSREIIVLTLRALASTEGVILSAITIAKRKTFLQIVAISFIIAKIHIFDISTILIGNLLLIISILLSWFSLIIYFNDFLKAIKKKH